MNIDTHLKGLGYEVTEFNTNNGWGFGGGYGKSYKKDGIEVRIGKACYRHAPSVKFTTVAKDGNRVYDKNGGITPLKFDRLIESL